MSAFLVSEDTIDLVLSVLQSVSTHHHNRLRVDGSLRDAAGMDLTEFRHEYGPELDPWMHADEIGGFLWRENIRSVDDRYPADADQTVPAYRFRSVNVESLGDAAILTAIKQVHCIRYQSCECDDYEQTNAAKFLDAIESILVTELPGYDEIKWGWTR